MTADIVRQLGHREDVDQVEEQLDVRDALPGIPAPAPEISSRRRWMLASHG
jgi:hypothetical protein